MDSLHSPIARSGFSGVPDADWAQIAARARALRAAYFSHLARRAAGRLIPSRHARRAP